MLIALKKERKAIKKRLKEIEEINSYTLMDFIDVKEKGFEIIEKYKKTNNPKLMEELKELIEKKKLIHSKLEEQTKNNFFIDEQVKLENRLQRIENEIYCNEKIKK